MMRRGFTLVEAVVGVGLAAVVLGIVLALFAPAQRQGAQLEERLTGVRGTMLVAARLEQDMQQATSFALEDGALVIACGARQIRWAHARGALTRDGEQAGGAYRFAAVSFEADGDRAVRVVVGPTSFTLRLPGEHSYWRPVDAKRAS